MIKFLCFFGVNFRYLKELITTAINKSILTETRCHEVPEYNRLKKRPDILTETGEFQ